MKLKCVGKRILSALLAFALTVSAMPAGQLVTFAEIAVDQDTTEANVETVQDYAAGLITGSNVKEDYSTGGFTWASTDTTSSWKYYNGMILDSFMLLGDELNNASYSQYVKEFYDKGNLESDGALVNYVTTDLGSVAMGLPLFELLETNESVLTDDEIADLEGTPFKVDDELFVQTNKGADFDLDDLIEKNKASFTDVYDASAIKDSDSADADLFVNGVVMTEFNGHLYCQWQTSKKDEDDPTNTKVVYSVSNDLEGTSWSEPIVLATADANTRSYYSSGGWYVNDNYTPSDTSDDILVAYLNYWPGDLTETEKKKWNGEVCDNIYADNNAPYKYGYTKYRSVDASVENGIADESTDWSDIGNVLDDSNQPLMAIFEQDPHVLDLGNGSIRIVNAAHFAKSTEFGGLFVNPIYTKDRSGITGWTKATYTAMNADDIDEENSTVKQTRELEPSMFVNADGNLVMIFRDDLGGTYHTLAAVSTDNGESWKSTTLTNLPDARQKQCAGNLPDGTAYIVNSPIDYTGDTGTKFRYPLTITLSKDGRSFNKAYVIGSTDRVGVWADGSKHTDVRYSGYAKRLGYHYPKSVVSCDYLYVSYARNKEIAEFVKIPLSEISLNKYENAIQNIYSNLTNEENYIQLTNGNYSEDGTSFTLSDVYMAQRFLIECANAIEDNKLTLSGVTGATDVYSAVCSSLISVGETLISTDGYTSSSDTTYKASEIGYYAMALVDTIAMLPSSMSTEKAELTSILENLFDSMLKYQDADTEDTEATGMWTSSVTDVATSTELNYEGSAMMAYALLKAYDSKIVTDENYGKAGLMAFNGIVDSGWPGNEANTDAEYASGVAAMLMASVYAEGVANYIENGDSYTEEEITELTWHKLESSKTETFETVNSMDPDHEDGYLIRNRNSEVYNPQGSTEVSNMNNKLTLSLSYFEDGVAKRTSIMSHAEGSIEYMEIGTDVKKYSNAIIKDTTEANWDGESSTVDSNIKGIEYDLLWLSESAGDGKYFIKSKDDPSKYLDIDNKTCFHNNTNGYEIIITDAENAEPWTIEVSDDGKEYRSYIYNDSLYMSPTDYKPEGALTYDHFYVRTQSTNKNINLAIWKRNVSYSEQIALSGVNSYTVMQDSYLTDTMLSTICEKAVIKRQDISTGEETEIELTTGNLSWGDTTLDTTKPGTYTAAVIYTDDADGETYNLGTITVNVTNAYTASLSGELSHFINKGDTLTADTIKKSAYITLTPLEGTSGSSQTYNLTEDIDGVTCTWDKDYTTEEAGIYTLFVSYYGEEIGQITVEVSNTDYTWYDVETDELSGIYKVVHEMDPNNEDGYIITRKGLNAGYKNGLSVDLNGSEIGYKTTPIYFPSYNALETISNENGSDTDHDYWYAYVDADDATFDLNNLYTWWIDNENHLYVKSTDNKNYYLNVEAVTEEGTANVSYKIVVSDKASTVWEIVAYNKDSLNVYRTANVELRTEVNKQNVYLTCDGDGTQANTNPGTFSVKVVTGNNNDILIWEPEHIQGKAALSGITVYNVPIGDTTVSVSSIQNNAQVLLKEYLVQQTDYDPDDSNNKNGSISYKLSDEEQKLPWSDPNITFSWDHPLNTNVAGAYVMTVRYNGVVLGTISVNVGDIDWTDVTNYVYERTTEIESGKYYIITDTEDDSVISDGTIINLANNSNTGNSRVGWATSNSVNISAIEGGYSILNTADNTNLGVEDRWYCDTENNLYTLINNSRYKLASQNGGSNGYIAWSNEVVRINTNLSAVWKATASDDDQTILSSTGVVEETLEEVPVYLNYNEPVVDSGDYKFQIIDSTSKVILYTPTNEQVFEVGMVGEDEYTVVADYNNMSETYLKARTSFYLKTTNADGSTSTERIPWTELEINWGENELQANTPGVYTMTVSYEGFVVGTITVNVMEIKSIVYSGPATITVGKGQTPDFSQVKATITYEDDDEDETNNITVEVTLDDGLEITNSYSTDEATPTDAPISMSIEYMGAKVSNAFSLVVDESPYYNLPETNEYPTYPEEGSVRLQKEALNDSYVSWYDTGVTKVELDVAGTVVRKGVDVILVTDISNSMGRFYPDDYEDESKRGKPGQKLDEAMQSASDLANSLLANGNANDNSISFVTFGGYDADNDGTGKTYIDATKTVFVYEKNYKSAIDSFNGTKFLSYGDSNIIQVSDNKGNTITGSNAGGTNYDYAFAEAMNAVMKLKSAYAVENGEAYDASGRKIVLLFMTDGAPTYYNYEGVTLANGGYNDEGKPNNYYLYGTTIPYPKSDDGYYPYVSNSLAKIKLVDGDFKAYNNDTGQYTISTDKTAPENYSTQDMKDLKVWINGEDSGLTYRQVWEARSDKWLDFTSNANQYAVELNSMVDAFYAVGFKMKEDLGQSTHCYNWGEAGFINVLAGVAGLEDGKQAVDGVVVADDAISLSKAYLEMTEQVASSGTYAEVYDEIASEYTLLMDTEIKKEKEDDSSEVSVCKDSEENVIPPNIQYNRYELSNGVRTGNLLPIEEVWFDYDSEGKLCAYSDVIGNDENILIDEDPSDNYYQIVAKYFIYTYDNGHESFKWYIDTIAGYEYSLSFYVYLTGTNSNYEDEGYIERAEGDYNTNADATITYVDINEDVVTRDFDPPHRYWGDAVTEVEFYLVDKDGNLINEKGVPVNPTDFETAFVNRQKVSVGSQWLEKLRTYISLDAAESREVTINAKDYEAYLPEGFKLYNEKASYNITINSEKQGSLITSMTDEDQNTNNDYYTTRRTDSNSEDPFVGQTKVAFAVYYVGTGNIDPLGMDRVVIDYGKTIQIDVFDNNPSLQSMYGLEVIGFVPYDANTDITQTKSETGTTKYVDPDGYGTFSILDISGEHSGHVVQYEPSKMIDKVVKVFTVVKVSLKLADLSYIYYQELEVIPATVMYYETDFADGVFTLNQTKTNTIIPVPDDYSKKSRVETYYSKWVTVSDNISTLDNLQDDGTVGTNPVQTYGYDDSYNQGDALLSNGTSLFVTGEGSTKNSETGKYEYNTTANFTFTGTGFDIISRTGHCQGMIDVKVYKVDGDTKTQVKKLSVLNKSDSEWEIYQIPVVSVELDEHATYYVEIGVLSESYFADESSPLAALLDRGNEFYFDAVRIYNPIYVPATDDTVKYDFDNIGYIKSTETSAKEDGTTTTTNTYLSASELNDKIIALSAYADDGEAYPEIYEVRNLLIDANTMAEGYEGEGTVVVDETYSSVEHIAIADMNELLLTGPNNEVYLKPGQAIAFKLEIPEDDVSKISSIDIGAKGIITVDEPWNGAKLYAELTSNKKDKCEAYGNWMNTSTAQYYSYSAPYGKTLGDMFTVDGNTAYTYVYIKNNGEEAMSVLSITDIKIAYNSKPSISTEGEVIATFSVGPDLMAYVSDVMFDYDIKSAKFESKTCNIFGNSTLLVQTSQDVESISITNRFGKELLADITYSDLEDGSRVWAAKMFMSTLGDFTCEVTGYNANGIAGESATASIKVVAKKGGGWQDAKNIYKTLFNCRILSIGRSSGNRMY